MPDYSQWAANRMGQAAAATTSSVSSRPDFGIAFDAGVAPLTPTQYEAMIAGLQTMSDDQEAEYRALELEQQMAEEPPREGGGFLGSIANSFSTLIDADIPVLSPTVRAMRGAGDALGVVAEGAGGAADLLRSAARKQDELVFGEDRAEDMAADREVARGVAGEALDWVTDTTDDVLAAPAQAINIAAADGWSSLFQGATWASAWERANNSTAGQAWTETGFIGFTDMTADEFSNFYNRGFDEYGRPNDRAYAELRESNVAYNLSSGTLDFVKTWFADPLVVGGKAASFARAMQRGDLTMLGARNAARVRQVVTAPDDAVASLNIKPWDIAGQNALRLRSKMHEVRDQIRRGEKDTVDLVNSEFAFTDAPDAASLFRDAALLRKRDPETLEQLDEFDDDTFQMAVGAMLGNGAALARLADDPTTRHVSDAINAIRDVRIPALDEAVRLSETKLEEIQTDPNLTGFQRYERAMYAQTDLAQAMDQAEFGRETLRGYEAYERFLGSVKSRAQSPVRAVPGTGVGTSQIIRDSVSHVYRPSGANGTAEVYTTYPRAAFMRRPGNADLSHSDSVYQAADRYFDQAVKYGDVKDMDAFQVARRDILNRAAAATTDVERRAVAAHYEDIGVEAVARKHGLSADDARTLASQIRGVRSSLFQDIQKRHAENSAYSSMDESGKSISAVSFKDGDQVRTVELPLDVTQLQNYHLATDLRALDSLLTRHGQAIKNELGELKAAGRYGIPEAIEEVMTKYNNFWKPSVLFRLGYPIRTVSDEALRILALTGSFTHMLGQMPQAAAIGAANLVPRVGNLARAPFRPAARRHWLDRNGDLVKGDASWSRIDGDRKTLIEKKTFPVKRYAQENVGAAARGGKPPKAPEIVTKLNKVIANSDDRFAVDVATGRKVNPKAEVFDFGLDRTEDFAELTGETLAEYAYRNADRLSHADGVLLVNKADDGYRVSIGRKGAGYRKFNTIKQRSLIARVNVGGQQFGAPAEPGEGDIYEALMSSDSFWRSMATSHEKNTSILRAAAMGGTRSVLGDAHHAESWAKVINDQIVPGPVFRRVLEFGPDDTVKWLNNTPEGREVKRRMVTRAHDPIKWTDKVQQHLDTYLPDEQLRAKVIAGEKITPEELQARIDRKLSPVPSSVDGESVAWDAGTSLPARMWSKFVEKGYHVLGTLPTDTLIRQPFFRSQYKARLKGMVNTLEDGAEISADARKLMERQAREFALRQTRRYLFSLADETELTHTLRFLSPFMGAWQETMTRWATIVMERPQALGRLWFNGWQDMDELFFLEMVDENGLGEHDEGHGELNYIRMPWMDDSLKFFDRFLPGDQSAAAAVFRNVKIDKRNLNTVLQGNPAWLPSGGPLVQFPAKALLGDRPDLADENGFTAFMYKYLFPTGVPEYKDALIPAGWMQQAYRLYQGEDDPVFQSLAANVYKMDIANWEAEGRVGPRPLESDAIEKAEAAQVFLIAGRMLSPASFTMEVGDPNNEFSGQYFIDAANRIQAEEGSTREAAMRFVAEHGDDAWLWWTSNSKSNTGIPGTSAGFKGQQEYDKLIQDFPELGLAIVGLDTQKGPFNYNVYQWQRQKGDRENISPEESLARAESEEGWRQWNQLNLEIDIELRARGLTSIEQAGAEDLAMTKTFFAQQLGEEKPGWRDSYSELDTDRSYDMLRSFQAAIDTGQAPDPRFRPDWRGVHEYLEINRAFGAELDARYLQGGTRNIEAEDNVDLRYAYAVAVGELVLSNPMFADLYHRFFENHSLVKGSG